MSELAKPEWVNHFEAALADHYGEPVKPVGFYCEAFRQWRQALIQANERGDFDEPWRDKMLADFTETVLKHQYIDLAITKSNLLARLIYGDGDLRTEKCPVHKGHWSGIGDPPCGCHDTGWLPSKGSAS